MRLAIRTLSVGNQYKILVRRSKDNTKEFGQWLLSGFNDELSDVRQIRERDFESWVRFTRDEDKLPFRNSAGRHPTVSECLQIGCIIAIHDTTYNKKTGEFTIHFG